MFSTPAMPINVSSKDLFIILALSVAALWSLFRYTRDWRNRRSRLLELVRDLPGPPTLPIFGNFLQLFCTSEGSFDRFTSIVAQYENSSPMRLWLGPVLHIVILKPGDIKAVLNDHDASKVGTVYKFMYPFMGDGLVSGSGKRWKLYRKMFTRAINPRLVRDCVEVFDRRSRIFIEKLKVLADGRIIDILETLEPCTVDIVCELVMGCTDINAQDDPHQDFVQLIPQFQKIIHSRAVKVWLRPDFIFKLTRLYRMQCKIQRGIRDFMEKCIAAKRKDISERKLFTDELNNSENEGNSVLERILEINNVTHELTGDEIRDEVYTIYAAAQDTIAVTISFMTLMLAMHEDVQKKGRQEVQQILKDGETITVESLDRMKYLTMIVKETLRLYPIAPLITRTSSSELSLETCTVPKDCEVVIAAYNVHRSQRYWKHPERFDPERFSSEESSTRDPYAFIPFGGGPMNCIGQPFAMKCMKTILANLLRSYRITTKFRMKDVKVVNDISLRSINGYKVSLEPLSGVLRSDRK